MFNNLYEKIQFKCMWLVLCILGFSVVPSWSSCYPPNPIRNSTFVISKNLTPEGKYPEKTEAKIECEQGFQLRNLQYQKRICVNGMWKWDGDQNPEDTICVIHCKNPPAIQNGFYKNEISKWKMGKAKESYPIGAILEPGCDDSYFLNCSQYCGRIVCGDDGAWISRDAIMITECVSRPLSPIIPPSPTNGRNHGSETTLKHYLVIVLAIVCIFIVCGITVVLLRRPNFCKKQNTRNGNRGASSGGGGRYTGGSEDNPIIITSSSPIPDPLNSLPVAMNTGIFLPGAGYDWQECRFQESTLTGTAVFK